jgi:hypothetical protein
MKTKSQINCNYQRQDGTLPFVRAIEKGRKEDVAPSAGFQRALVYFISFVSFDNNAIRITTRY